VVLRRLEIVQRCKLKQLRLPILKGYLIKLRTIVQIKPSAKDLNPSERGRVLDIAESHQMTLRRIRRASEAL
jgi:hypothetical protein